MNMTIAPPLGSFADGFVQTHLLLQQQQRLNERSKLELDLLTKEAKLKEKRQQFEEEKLLEDLKSKQQKQAAQQAVLQLFAQPQAQTDPLQQTLAGMPFETAPPEAATGNAPTTAPANPVLQQALAPRPQPTGLAAMPENIRQLVPTLLLGGYGDMAMKFAEPYLPQRAKAKEPYTLAENARRFDEHNRLVAEGKPKAEEAVTPGLVDAVMAQPQLYDKLPAATRATLTPALVERGFKAADLTTAEDRQLQQLRIAKYQAEINAANRTASGALSTADQRKLALNVRQDIRQEPAFKDLMGARSGHTAVMVGATQANAQGDLAIVNGIARLLDPGSVVRPSEFDTVRRTQGLIDQIEGFAQRLAKGEILTPKVRQQFVDLANNLQHEWERTAQREVEKVYGPVLKGTGIALSDVWVEPSTLRATEPAPTTAPTGPQAGGKAGTGKPLDQMTTPELLKAFDEAGGR
jgi:hypothetical protein